MIKKWTYFYLAFISLGFFYLAEDAISTSLWFLTAFGWAILGILCESENDDDDSSEGGAF